MENILRIISQPDNIAIVLLLLLVGFFSVAAFRLALQNDRQKKAWASGEGGPEEVVALEEEKIHTWPYLARKEFLVTVLVTVFLLAWSVALDAPLEEQANPTLTPNPAKAPWYFVGLQEMLVYFDPWIAGVMLPGLIIFGLMAIPYLDTNPQGRGYYSWAERKIEILVFGFGFFLWVGLILIGTFMRGPGWMWFWPWETWDPSKTVQAANVDLSEFFSIPSRSVLGSLIGGMAVSGYYVLGVLLPYLYVQRRSPEKLQRVGRVRYVMIFLLLLTMLALPIKMVLRLAINLKYFWVTPWFSI
jgi:hypothetical protein